MTLTIYTGRIAYSGVDRMDITVKSGTGIGALFAPKWDMVMGHKRGNLTDEQYTLQYFDLIRPRYSDNRLIFLSLFDKMEITFCCYCRAGVFCHRHLAVDILMKIAGKHGRGLIRGGER